MMYESPPIPLLALRTVTYCTENEWTPYRASIGGLILKADATVTESAKK
jgi:hypothetical protein